MGYIEANLLPGETVVQRARLRWIVFLKAIAVVVVGLVVLILFQPVVGAVIGGGDRELQLDAVGFPCELEQADELVVREPSGSARRHDRSVLAPD